MIKLAAKFRNLLKDTRGVSMVEFALIVTVLLFIVIGTIEFGLIWYTKYCMAAAAREGARYAVLFQPDASGNRILPCNMSPSIETVATNYLSSTLPKNVVDACSVTVPNQTACYTAGKTGQDLTVRITCTNPWDLLGGFLPFMKNLNFTAEAVMRCE